MELRGEWIKVERITHEWLEKSRQFEELQGEMRKIEWSTHKLEQEKSELSKIIEEEQTGNSQDRENLEKEWKKKS